jgi:hypothetical protein
MDVPTAVPAGRGGAPVPGSYYLTEWDWYTGPGGDANRLSVALGETVEMSVAGNVVTLQIVQNDGPETANVHQTMVLTLSGTTAVAAYLCPSSLANGSANGPIAYAATATTFELLAGGRGYVYTKQADGPIDLVAACMTIQNDYAVALRAAQTCDPTGTSQCQSTAFTLQLGCQLGCQVAVQDDSTLSATAARWATAGCGSIPGATCVSGCRGPMGHCVAQDGGTGLCVPP